MKEYLICIDSDGCAIDSMEIKHRRCFGPCIIDIWHLEPFRQEILDRWNEMNLYSMTRGINRFLGLEKMLTEINSAYRPIEGLLAYSGWCHTTENFSNGAIEAEIQKAGSHPIFRQVLAWSQAVNRAITEISPQIRPFPGVKTALDRMRKHADIAIVSSANPQAVAEEWTRFGFMEYVDYVMAQDAGTKSDCIERLIALGYSRDHILVLGDAPGDARAASGNGVWYYPILAGGESGSWDRLSEEALPRLFAGLYDQKYQRSLLTQFYHNLGGEKA
ncbi:MAG: HAD family hydrolase [Faecousia sp.]